MSAAQESHKIAIVGCGRVGTTAAYSILSAGIATELVLVGRDLKKVTGEKLDLEHGLAFLPSAKITATTNYKDIVDSDIVIIAAGVAQQPGQSRLELATTNAMIVAEIVLQVLLNAPAAIIMIATNPVDVLTYQAYQLAGLPKGRIFGTGTVLDTARFKFHLSETLRVNPHNIHAYILGEHGDSSFPVVSNAQVGGQAISTFPGMSEQKIEQAFHKTKTAAQEIIAQKGATYYGIGTAICRIARAVLRDERSILPVSAPLHDYHGHFGVALSVPAIIGRNGVEQQLEIKLSWEEKQLLAKSAQIVRNYLELKTN